jgi:hypothetical protein
VPRALKCALNVPFSAFVLPSPASLSLTSLLHRRKRPQSLLRPGDVTCTPIPDGKFNLINAVALQITARPLGGRLTHKFLPEGVRWILDIPAALIVNRRDLPTRALAGVALLLCVASWANCYI